MQRKATRNTALLGLLSIGTLALGIARYDAAAHQDDADTAANIANAVSAGPAAVTDAATILDNAFADDGTFVVLREGSNGLFCFPDASTTPGNDPWCFNQPWLDWTYALAAGEEPKITEPGLAYMFQGGSDASNTDPFATAPPVGEDWVNSPPHIMLLLPDALNPDAYSTDHASGQPYIMWVGTPYEHIMMPIAEGEHME